MTDTTQTTSNATTAPTDPAMRYGELACSSDREWASLHANQPGIWRIRPRVGAEGVPRQIRHPDDGIMRVVLVAVLGPTMRIRRFFATETEARMVARHADLLPEDER